MTAGAPGSEAKLPPIAELAVASMVLVIIGGIYMAAHLPGSISLAIPTALFAVAIVVLFVNILLLTRIRPFAWKMFFRVAGWALLAYLVIAGMIGYAFIYDGTRGESLALLIGMLAVFAFAVPIVLGFTVARYQPPDGARVPATGASPAAEAGSLPG